MIVTDIVKAVIDFPKVVYWHILDSCFGVDVSCDTELTSDDVHLDGIELQQ